MEIVWKKYRSPRAVFAALFNLPAKDVPPDDETVKMIRARGMWAFVAWRRRPVQVHYWHDGRRTLTELAFMLGHELGHASGTRARGERKEENRADEYGRVAAAVFKKLVPGSGAMPPEGRP